LLFSLHRSHQGYIAAIFHGLKSMACPKDAYFLCYNLSAHILRVFHCSREKLVRGDGSCPKIGALALPKKSDVNKTEREMDTVTNRGTTEIVCGRRNAISILLSRDPCELTASIYSNKTRLLRDCTEMPV
jgi:hypothetical protein